MTRILIVDDNADMRECIRDIVESFGYDTCDASCGQQSVELAALVRPDLIILDVCMPDMNGWEVMNTIRESETAAPTPIIFCSGSCKAKTRYHADPPAVSSFVPKPFICEKMAETIEKHLSGSAGFNLPFEHSMSGFITCS